MLDRCPGAFVRLDVGCGVMRHFDALSKRLTSSAARCATATMTLRTLWLFRLLGSLIATVLFCLPSIAQESSPAPDSGKREGRAAELAKRLDNPARDANQKPEEVIRALALRPDAVIADIGAGTGYFASHLARSVPQGTVYAVDIDPQMVRLLKELAAREELTNLVPIQSVPDDPMLPVPVDLALMANVYQAISDREGYVRALRRKLTPTGRLAILSARPGAGGGSPERLRYPSEQIKVELERSGYLLVEEHGFLPNHYFFVFRPRADSN
jgi:SAM-dependent methyltransferase